MKVIVNGGLEDYKIKPGVLLVSKAETIIVLVTDYPEDCNYFSGVILYRYNKEYIGRYEEDFDKNAYPNIFTGSLTLSND